MSTWDGEAINGKDLQEQVVQNLASEIKKRGLAEVIAETLVNLDSRMKAVENTVNEENIGERIADSLDAQVLKEGGSPVLTEETAPAVNNGTLTIKQGSTTLGTFTANQSGNTTVTIANQVQVVTDMPTTFTSGVFYLL